MDKKIIGMLVCTLVVFATVFPVAGILIVKKTEQVLPQVSLDDGMRTGNIIYVGGSGPNNYTTIQAGVDAANPGDTVFVYHNTYYEYVIVPHEISLIGENKETTIINGNNNGDVLDISHNVMVTGFTIMGGGPASAGIYSHGDYAIITGNIIKDNIDFSIYLDGSSLCVLTDNLITNNLGNGITVKGSNNTITGNTIHLNGGYGLTLLNGNYNKVFENNIEENCNGIYIHFWSYYNSIYHNTFIANNGINAIDKSGGSTTVWDAGYPCGGNYWDDHIDLDGNHDGISDIPYNISGKTPPSQDHYPLIHRFVLGDMNVDGIVDFGDINPFVLALSNPLKYQNQYHILPALHGDINQNGVFGFDDIDPFVALLTGGEPTFIFFLSSY